MPTGQCCWRKACCSAADESGSMRRAGRSSWRERVRAMLLTAALVAAALAGNGCGGGREQAARPVPGSDGGFPVVVRDAEGEEVWVERRPRRIVSAAPVATEILFAVGAGDRVVAVTDQCNYPGEVKGLSRIGRWFTPSVEKGLAAEPDLVIASRGNPRDFVAALRKAGCPVLTIDPKTLEDIFAVIGDIGRATGAVEGAEALAGEMRERLAAVMERVKEVPERERPRAFIVLQVNPVWTAGSGTFQDDAIRAAGGRNIAAEKRGFTAFSTETLMAADPDYLLLSTMEGDPDRMKREVVGSPALRGLSAVREGRLVVLEADPIMRPGPRIIDAVEAMTEAFYGGRFGR
jgi:iron complex transport system substrate-binding protein